MKYVSKKKCDVKNNSYGTSQDDSCLCPQSESTSLNLTKRWKAEFVLIVIKYCISSNLLPQELNKKRTQKEMEHALMIRQDESTQDMERRQLQMLQKLRIELMRLQHQTELENQEEYNGRRQRELHRKHTLEQRQQPRNLKVPGTFSFPLCGYLVSP